MTIEAAMGLSIVITIETLMSHNNRNGTKRRGQRESFIIASAEGTVRL